MELRADGGGKNGRGCRPDTRSAPNNEPSLLKSAACGRHWGVKGGDEGAAVEGHNAKVVNGGGRSGGRRGELSGQDEAKEEATKKRRGERIGEKPRQQLLVPEAGAGSGSWDKNRFLEQLHGESDGYGHSEAEAKKHVAAIRHTKLKIGRSGAFSLTWMRLPLKELARFV